MSAPGIYAAIHAVGADLASAGIPKSRTNEVDGYKYRSIDDVLDKLAPLLAKHRLCVLPNALERVVVERRGEGEGLLLHVALRVAFTLTCVDDGTCHIVEAYGEAMDAGDKATAKAMSVAYKTAMVQTFCIPICAGDDPDKSTHRLSARRHLAEPIQGWEQWSLDIIDIISVCESDQAIATVQERQRELLKAISRERPALYADLGHAFSDRRELIRGRTATAVLKPRKRVRASKAQAEAPVGRTMELDHA